METDLANTSWCTLSMQPKCLMKLLLKRKNAVKYIRYLKETPAVLKFKHEPYRKALFPFCFLHGFPLFEI